MYVCMFVCLFVCLFIYINTNFTIFRYVYISVRCSYICDALLAPRFTHGSQSIPIKLHAKELKLYSRSLELPSCRAELSQSYRRLSRNSGCTNNKLILQSSSFLCISFVRCCISHKYFSPVSPFCASLSNVRSELAETKEVAREVGEMEKQEKYP